MNGPEMVFNPSTAQFNVVPPTRKKKPPPKKKSTGSTKKRHPSFKEEYIEEEGCKELRDLTGKGIMF